MRFQRGNGVVLQEWRAAFGDHHRVKHQRAEAAGAQAVGDAGNHFRRAEHADFVGGDVKVCGNGGELRAHAGNACHFDMGDAARVLRGDGGEDAGGENAAHLHGFDVGLDAGATATV